MKMVEIPPDADLRKIFERLLNQLGRENAHIPLTKDETNYIIKGMGKHPHGH